jgi:hypothetical protein
MLHDDGVPVPGEPQQFREFWPRGVPAGGLVHKDPIQNLAFELALLVLVQRAHANVPDPLSSHLRLPPLSCQVEF